MSGVNFRRGNFLRDFSKRRNPRGLLLCGGILLGKESSFYPLKSQCAIFFILILLTISIICVPGCVMSIDSTPWAYSILFEMFLTEQIVTILYLALTLCSAMNHRALISELQHRCDDLGAGRRVKFTARARPLSVSRHGRSKFYILQRLYEQIRRDCCWYLSGDNRKT